MEEAENGVRNRSPKRGPRNGVRKPSPSPTRENGARNRSPTRAPRNGVRKLSPSPTRSSAPEQRKPSASPPAPRVPKWLILDTIAHRCSRRHCGVVENDATASALAHDCAGRPVRASLRIADPPAVSRLYLHLTGRPSISFQEPTAIAAHRNSILFQLTVPFEDPMWWHHIYAFPIDYFVYSCRSSSPPSLTLLPPCFDGGSINPQLDQFCKPHRQQRQRCMLFEDMGILCHGDEGKFTVAELTFSGRYEIELCLLHNPAPAGSSMEWNVKKVQIPPDTKINTKLWMTDAVLPIGTCLCWVDNYQGMLVIDVLTDSNSNPDHQLGLRYIPMPKKALKKSQRKYKDPSEPDPFRSVCVTDIGIIKLVCILTECPPFTIKAWTLDDIHEGTWTMDLSTTMGAEDFFSLLGAGHSCLPQVQPSFPLVSLVDPDVICFLLEDKDCGLFWMIDVNMKNKELKSSALYINEEEEDGYPPKRDCRNDFFGHCFIPSKFSSYFSENAITSRDLSEKMQKTKKDRVMQKSGLEAQLE